MFKPTAPLYRRIRRLPLTTKMVNKGFYKGNRVGSMGAINQYGRFKPDYSKIRTYPEPIYLKETNLTPFVSKVVEKVKVGEDGEEGEGPNGGKWDGQRYLMLWKERNGQD
ncbi:uncharacterized protein BDR25DRAFT_265398 [Lindgomyces ingoldianus]|uniref:Uncharacterized protein n=1 Tax=Lindgomyces ingoldianus TaxID=673940 RepID=A0ACB6QNZ3_9PLEO|nr:uncharacterized protein BDR25DRAFT_265398 [Lindgomyces ingoldianus]KAF2468626.1 hypothetical protein BDR25DRAFT_265398 [Lindgomyces ingoldianus]